ncbi:MAG: hypothetical protein Q8P80_03385 [Candidatus Levybacteria bacterium]|nr:hypothetical protein [Candidatus Levybacteria bacterium]
MSIVKDRVSNFKFLGISYILVIFGLFFYSFTQVDLGLTLTRWSVWQVFQKFFQNIGYFQRPLSTAVYLIIVALLFIFYILFLKLADKKKITKRQVWTLVIVTSVILGFSYNAFSYDLFNYIFDAKIITFYHQNPYFHKALDYPGDPMLSFMHWTHRTFPYGPSWLLLTTPLSFLGMQIFLPTFFLFKALMTASFLGTVFFLGKILKKISPENEIFGLVFFGLNPLVVIESLVSSHNDIVMIFLGILAVYLLINTKYVRSFFILLLSIGVKFATIFLLPIFITAMIWQKQKRQISWDKIWMASILGLIIAIVFASIRTNFQPWYLLYIMPFTAFLGRKYFIFIPTIIICFFSLLVYVPFLYTGNWNPPIPLILFWITTVSILLSAFSVLVYSILVKRN